MPTTRPRHPITETPPVAEILDEAARRWGDRPRSKLIQLILEDWAAGGRAPSSGCCSNTARRIDAGHRWCVRPTRGLAGVIVADVSWVIALSDPADPHHAAAVALDQATIDEVVVLHPITLAECLVGPASSGLFDEAAGALRSAFTIASVDVNAPLRWAALRAATGLRLPDSIVLDTAVVGGANAILTFDQQLAVVAMGRSIDCPT